MLQQEAKEVINEMIKIQQLLRATSPSHAMSAEQRAQVDEAISKSETALGKMKNKGGQ